MAAGDVFSPRRRKRHRHAHIEDGGAEGWPLVVTPVTQWVYALEYFMASRPDTRSAVTVSLELTVLAGEVGIGCMARGNRFICETFRDASDGRTTATLLVEDFAQCHSLMIRNASATGRSVAEIHDVTVSVDGETVTPEVPESDASAPLRPFEAGTRTRHPGASLVEDGAPSWPLVVTPATEWQYALEFPVAHRFIGRGAVLINVDLTVLRGEAGIGCMGRDETMLCEAFRSAEDGATTATLLIEDFSKVRSLMVRSGPTPGRSVAQINGVRVTRVLEVPQPPLLVIGAETFSRFGSWTGLVPPGFYGDWLGVLTRADVHAFSRDPAEIEMLKVERGGTFPPPTTTELLLDWEPLLEAEELAGPRFTAVALGAGWGRWIVGCAFAAMTRGRDYHIVGVEAEPQHFSWMERHLKDNNISPEKARLINAAVNSYTGTCWFMVGNARAEYGQAVVSDFQYRSAQFQQLMRDTGVQAVETPCVDLSEVLSGIERVDYLHLDVQGSEAEVLLACPELLDERVAVVNIGTHSELIERRLRRHFAGRGWLCRYDIPMNSTIEACIKGEEPRAIPFGDGVQVWENPRLTGRTEVWSFVVPTLIRG